MKRLGLHRPTLEETIELSGIETLHPGGLALTRRTAEVAGMAPGQTVLDVSSGRGTQAVLYAREYGVEVTGIDLAESMVASGTTLAAQQGLADRVRFERGDSQDLPWDDGSFDVVINECAVGIPDDSQRVLDEMLRVLRPGGRVVIHESTWRAPADDHERRDLAERYGTTPLAAEEWMAMLARAGASEIDSELEPWSRPKSFWNVRQGRQVSSPRTILTLRERLLTLAAIVRHHGLGGVFTAMANERVFWRAVLDGKLGYGLYWGLRPAE